MAQVGLWQITGDGPRALNPASVDLEAQLESWIAQDPDMLQRGLTVVGRQVRVEGGILDLLAIDPQGNWVVIEIKRGTIYRETLTQALDYATSIARLPFADLMHRLRSNLANWGNPEATLDDLGIEEESNNTNRDVSIFVVGTGKAPDLERMVDYLSSYNIPISVVTYEVFELPSGERILLRELTDADQAAPEQPVQAQHLRLDDLEALARQHGVGEEFQILVQAAQKHDIYPRPYKHSVMFTPPNKRTRMLFTIRVRPNNRGNIWLYNGPAVFAEFYNVSAEEATRILGHDGWHEMDTAQIQQFARNLDVLFEQINRH